MGDVLRIALPGLLCCVCGFGALSAAEKAPSEEKKVATKPEDKKSAAKPEKHKKVLGGAELWAQNCRRCHNSRPPNTLSDDDWEVVVNHMRIRANLTAEEARKITAFFKMAN